MPHAYDLLDVAAFKDKHCLKWHHYPRDVLPLWVADMDFPTAEPIKEALVEQASSNNLGYPVWKGLPGLIESAVEHLKSHNWHIEAADVHLLNGIIPGLYLASLACASEGEEVIIQSPIYPPFMMAVNETRRVPLYNQLRRNNDRWEIDFEHLESLLTPATRLLMLCNPHNPTGHVYSREELEKLAEFVLRHRLWVVSDELHSDLIYPGYKHIPFASLNPELAQRTITLFGPTKSFNIAGLKIGFMIVQNHALLSRLRKLAHGLVWGPNVMAQAASIAAYRQGQEWLADTVQYLDGNRKLIADFLADCLPQVRYLEPKGTYLAWLDFSALELGDNLHNFLLNKAQVGLNPGPSYGPGGEGFARLNFATSRAIVQEALERIHQAVKTER